MFASYEKQQSELTDLLAENEKKLAELQKTQVDIYFTAVGLFNLPTAEEVAKLLAEAKAEQNSLKPA